MKFKKIAPAIALAFLATAAHAHIVIDLPSSLKNEDACSAISGNWQGEGKIHASIPIFTPPLVINCVYTGGGETKKESTSTFHFHGKLDLVWQQSSPLCPSSQPVDFQGYCANGKIVVNDPKIKLNGNINPTASHIDLTGEIYATILSVPITAYVDSLHLDKK